KTRGQTSLPRACSSSPGALRRNITNARIDTGPFWEDRYHATAVEADEHLHRCIVYIDLNMVRAGAVNHPFKWAHSGYREIQEPPKRYAVIDLEGLAALCGFTDLRDFQRAHRQWVEQALENG
ncbi:MAG TPA: transposase, partial [Candidatus Binatia bacterium]|nr:transposase [Candidatus Binatia bacterium]